MVSWEKRNEIPGKTRKLKEKKRDKKRGKKKTRRFWLSKKERKRQNVFHPFENMYTELTETDISQPLRKKGGTIENPRLTVNTYAKGLEKENKLYTKPFLDNGTAATTEKQEQNPKEIPQTPNLITQSEIVPYDIGTESTVSHDNVG